MSRFPPFVVYLSPQLKRIFKFAADHAHKSLSEHVRNLLAADIEKRASLGEPHFDVLASEMSAALESNRLREIEIRSRPRPGRRKEQSSNLRIACEACEEQTGKQVDKQAEVSLVNPQEHTHSH